MSKSSPMIFKNKGDLANAERLFGGTKRTKLLKILEKYGQTGVGVLTAATPVRTGKTAASWTYAVKIQDDSIMIEWTNTNTASNGDNIVTLLVRGHGTRNGHYVRGNDFVTPAIKPIFDQMATDAWAEVTHSDG